MNLRRTLHNLIRSVSPRFLPGDAAALRFETPVTDGQPITLTGRQLLSVPAAGSLQIACTEGAVWVTSNGVDRDVVLEPGQRHMVSDAQGLILQSLDAVTVVRIEVLQQHWEPSYDPRNDPLVVRVEAEARRSVAA